MGAASFTRQGGGQPGVRGLSTPEDTLGPYRVVRGTLVGSATYATGGETIDLNAVGLSELFYMLIDHGINGLVSPGSGFSLALTGTSKAPKLQIFATANTELANGLAANTIGCGCWLLGV